MTLVQGIFVSRTEQLHGEDHLGIQPPSKDGITIPEGAGIDASFVEIITKQKAAIQPRHGFQEPCFELGDEVIHEITGFKGTVTCITTFANGCKQARIRAKVDEKNFCNSEHFNVAGVKKVKTQAPKEKEREPARKTGGPNSALQRRVES